VPHFSIIAAISLISVKAVHHHVANVLRKPQAADRAQALMGPVVLV
jgi:DNA-binding NarL/FixJ family response regulator